MEVSDEEWLEDSAQVTAEGILFAGYYYTCSLAMQERWYEHALNTGPWSVDVCYEAHSAAEPATLYIDVQDTYVLCRPIRRQDSAAADAADASEYYAQMQQLLAERRSLAKL